MDKDFFFQKKNEETTLRENRANYLTEKNRTVLFRKLFFYTPTR